jgi:hypothetical protein
MRKKTKIIWFFFDSYSSPQRLTFTPDRESYSARGLIFDEHHSAAGGTLKVLVLRSKRMVFTSRSLPDMPGSSKATMDCGAQPEIAATLTQLLIPLTFSTLY